MTFRQLLLCMYVFEVHKRVMTISRNKRIVIAAEVLCIYFIKSF